MTFPVSTSRSGSFILTAFFLVVAAVFVGCGSSTPPAAESANSWPDFRDKFIDRYFEHNPHFAVVQGRHEFDGRLNDWSPAGLAAKIEFLKASRAEAEKFDVKSLDEASRFERDYLVATIDADLFWLETAAWPARNPYFYAAQMDPNVYIARPYAPIEKRMAAYIKWLSEVPRVAEQMRTNLRTPLPKTYVAIGRLAFGGLSSYAEKDVPAVFAQVTDGSLKQQFITATAQAVDALKKLDAWFAQQEASATDDFAIGANLFSEMLAQTEMVDLPLERVEAIGRDDLERNTKSLEEACAKYAPGKSLTDCVLKMKAHKPEGGPVAAARKQLPDLRQFVVDHNIVSVPGDEEAQVNEAPPYNRWNAAYIDIPGPYEKGLPSVYYIAPPDPKWSEKERNEYIAGNADLLFISVHEVWPGHFLNFLHSNRSPSKFGQVFVGYAYAEGWAHYTEEMMWDQGLSNGDPEIHIGQLTNALLRNVRYLSAVGLHTGKMTVADSEKMFIEKAFQDKGNASQQANRGTFDPAYLNYTLGKLMIRKLRDDWVAKNGGGREKWRDFHDQFLKFGGPPIPLVRAAMLGDGAGSPL